MAHLTFSTTLLFGGPEHVVDDQTWDVHARGGNAVAELHGVVDLVDLQPLLGFKNVDGDDAAADRARRAQGEILQLVPQRAIGRLAALSGVRDPVFGASV